MRRVLLVGSGLVLCVVLAPPASASHTVRWGVGPDCHTATRSAATSPDVPVRFVVCVALDGSPLADHPMSVKVAGPVREVELDIATDDDGIARFGVQPTATGRTTVTLCDDDGCVYGEATIVVSGGSTTSASSATTTSTIGSATSASQPASRDGGDDGVPRTAIAGGLAVLGALGAVAWWGRRRSPHVAAPDGLDGVLTRADLRALAAIDPTILDDAAAAARAAPAMAVEDHLDFYLGDVYRRVDAAVQRQMDRVQLLGPGGGDLETLELKRLLEARAAVSELRRRVAGTPGAASESGDLSR